MGGKHWRRLAVRQVDIKARGGVRQGPALYIPVTYVRSCSEGWRKGGMRMMLDALDGM